MAKIGDCGGIWSGQTEETKGSAEALTQKTLQEYANRILPRLFEFIFSFQKQIRFGSKIRNSIFRNTVSGKIHAE